MVIICFVKNSKQYLAKIYLVFSFSIRYKLYFINLNNKRNSTYLTVRRFTGIFLNWCLALPNKILCKKYLNYTGQLTQLAQCVWATTRIWDSTKVHGQGTGTGPKGDRGHWIQGAAAVQSESRRCRAVLPLAAATLECCSGCSWRVSGGGCSSVHCATLCSGGGRDGEGSGGDVTYLIAGPQTVHGADLLRCQCLAEQVNRRHLTTEDALLIQFGRGANIALVKGLQREREEEHYVLPALGSFA